MRKWLVATVPVGIILIAVLCASYMQPEKADAQAKVDPACKSFFKKSLHATGEGMRYWYEEKGGFMQVTGVPYKDLDCKNCHADSCDVCHADKKDGTCLFSVAKAKKEETCLQCHARTKKARALDKAAGITDVHLAKGMGCSDCHSAADVHGDGKEYHSMRDPGAVKVSCTSGKCHQNLNKAIRPHSVHKRAKIHCNACHVSSTVTCMNCHFDKFLEEKSRKGNFFAAKSWTLLVNHEGWVTTGNAQTLVGKGKKFVAYVPYFTHSVVKEGKKCTDCHGTDAAKAIAAGKPVEMAKFANGKVTHFKGVVPFVPELLKWPWLDKKDGKWVELEGGGEPIIQKACYVEPLTEKQLKKLKAPFKK